MPLLTIKQYGFFFRCFFLADLLHVGFILVGDFMDIQRRKINSLFVSQNKSSLMNLFLS